MTLCICKRLRKCTHNIRTIARRRAQKSLRLCRIRMVNERLAHEIVSLHALRQWRSIRLIVMPPEQLHRSGEQTAQPMIEMRTLRMAASFQTQEDFRHRTHTACQRTDQDFLLLLRRAFEHAVKFRRRNIAPRRARKFRTCRVCELHPSVAVRKPRKIVQSLRICAEHLLQSSKQSSRTAGTVQFSIGIQSLLAHRPVGKDTQDFLLCRRAFAPR